jgi:DNA-binding transcriptional regulator YdaS (Cro superfamily)
MRHRNLIKRAIKIAGSQEELAAATGLTQQGISYLLNDAKKVSGEAAVAIHKATNGQISKEDLRPDLFKGEAA